MMTYKCVMVIEVYHLRKVHTRKHVSLHRAAERRRRVCRDKVNAKTKVKVNDKIKINDKGPDKTKVNDKVKSKVRRYFE